MHEVGTQKCQMSLTMGTQQDRNYVLIAINPILGRWEEDAVYLHRDWEKGPKSILLLHEETANTSGYVLTTFLNPGRALFPHEHL